MVSLHWIFEIFFWFFFVISGLSSSKWIKNNEETIESWWIHRFVTGKKFRKLKLFDIEVRQIQSSSKFFFIPYQDDTNEIIQKLNLFES